MSHLLDIVSARAIFISIVGLAEFSQNLFLHHTYGSSSSLNGQSEYHLRRALELTFQLRSPLGMPSNTFERTWSMEKSFLSTTSVPNPQAETWVFSSGHLAFFWRTQQWDNIFKLYQIKLYRLIVILSRFPGFSIKQGLWESLSFLWISEAGILGAQVLGFLTSRVSFIWILDAYTHLPTCWEVKTVPWLLRFGWPTADVHQTCG